MSQIYLVLAIIIQIMIYRVLGRRNDDDDLEIPAFLRRQKINGLQENKWKPP